MRRMKKLGIALGFTLGFLVAVNAAKAQDDKQDYRYVSITGQIKDSKTGEILRGVKIYNESRSYGALSKQNGFYTIVAVTGDIIRFSHVGYEPLYMKINDNASTKETIGVELEENSIYIEEIIVGELPSFEELDEVFMAYDVDEDQSRVLTENNPETFNILEEINEPGPRGPVSFLKKHVFDKIKEKKRKRGKAKSLPKYKK